MKESTTRGRREISVTNVQSQFLDDRCFGIETTNSRRGDPREKNLALFPSSRMAFGGNHDRQSTKVQTSWIREFSRGISVARLRFLSASPSPSPSPFPFTFILRSHSDTTISAAFYWLRLEKAPERTARKNRPRREDHTVATLPWPFLRTSKPRIYGGHLNVRSRKPRLDPHCTSKRSVLLSRSKRK